MNQTNRFYRYNVLLFVYTLFCLQFLQACGESVSIYSLQDAMDDVTAIYRITNMSTVDNIGFEKNSFIKNNGSYTVEIYSKAKAVGIPIQNEKYELLRTNVKELFNTESIESILNGFHEFDSELWTKKKILPDGYDCLDNGSSSYENYTGTIFKKCLNTFEYKIKNRRYVHSDSVMYIPYAIFSLQWTPDINYTCLSITYFNRLSSPIGISMEIFNENNEQISIISLKKGLSIQILKLTDINFMKDQQYTLKLKSTIPTRTYYSNDYHDYDDYESQSKFDHVQFGLHRIAPCSDSDREVRTVSMDYMDYINLVNYDPILELITRKNDISRDLITKECSNNGYLINSTCTCPLDFNGKYCETGCGMNSYGTDCNEICSIDDRMCRGMLMCTKYECTCPAGLTGPLCNEDCESGRYGPDCRQTCPENCQNKTCDQYTGVCLNGCSYGYILPYCVKKYPYFTNAPTAISIEYETIKFELNFQSQYITGGDKSIHLKYYQLLYKKLSESEFSYSEIKLVNLTDEKTTEKLHDLQPKTTYLVGVLLITDDGNENDQDIAYGEYVTSCIQPETTEYNVQLISGVKSIHVTWNKVISNRFECEVIEYVLTLQLSLSDQLHNTRIRNYTREIIASSDSGNFIDNLLSGFQYNIKLTPKTIKGPLQSSPTYSITTLIKENEISIKNLTVKNEDRKIIVHWKLVNLHQTAVNEPLTCIIRYSIEKILSCSLKQIEHNWTSIKIFNRTNYEILDVIPNSQYIIQVFIDDENTTSNKQQNMAFILTSDTYPKTAPILDTEHPIYVSNNSVTVQWKMNPENCAKLNGFFSKFYITLTDKDDSTVQIKETKKNYIFFDGLRSNTAYELKVFIRTHVGYNFEHFLFVNFTTKHDELTPVEDLMVYKKSLKKRMAGFRWSYAANTNIDGFIVSFNDTTTVIPLDRCSAWPQYYCHTFYNLSPSNTYTFKIMPRSQDYPEGGKASSITFNSIDGLPDPPTNLKTTEVGSTSVTLQWDIPWIFNGLIKTFNINVEEISAIDMDTCCNNITPIEIPLDEELPTYNYTLTNLRPGSTYSIGVLTVSKSLWYSSLARISVETLNY